MGRTNQVWKKFRHELTNLNEVNLTNEGNINESGVRMSVLLNGQLTGNSKHTEEQIENGGRLNLANSSNSG